MKVKELIKLLKECDQEKEVQYSSYSEGILMGIAGVDPNGKDNIYPPYPELVLIEESKE